MALIFHARAYTAKQQFEKALEAWERVLKKNKKDTEALSGAGRTCYNNGKIKLARDYLERALHTSPDSHQIKRSLSLVYLRQKEWSKAMPILEEECKRVPDLFTNWERRINLLHEMNKAEDAKKCLNEILEFTSDLGDAHFMAFAVSKSYFWNEDADNHLSITLELKKNDAEFMNKFVKYYLEQGNLTQTLKYLLKGLELDSKNKTLLSSKNELLSLTKSVKVSLESLESDLINGKQVLLSECAIKSIFKRAEKNKINNEWLKNKNIAIISSSLNRGGAERQVISCLEGITPSDYNATLFCYGIDNSGGTQDTYEAEARKLNTPIIEYGKVKNWTSNFNKSEELLEPWNDLLIHLNSRMRREIEPMFLNFLKLKPSIVHTWQDTTNIFSGLAAAMAGVPKILMFARSLRPDGKTMLHMRNREYLKECYKEFINSERFTLCLNSNAGAESYSQWLQEPTSSIKVLYNGTDFDGIENVCDNKNISKELKKFKITKEQKVIGSVFRFVMEKRPFLWIDSAEKVLQTNPELQFVMIGGGGLFEAAQKQIINRNLSSNIHLVGQTNLVKLWLDRMDLFLMTSIVEGLPNVLIEAQGFGVPVISTDAGGAKETFIQGKTGYLVTDPTSENIANKINKTIIDEEWLANAAIFSSDIAREKFSKKIMHKNLIKLYQEL